MPSRKHSDKKPNRALIAARAATPSPSGSERQMSRQEVADACNAIIADLCERRGIRSRWAGMTDRTIGALERGDQTWANELYREALCILFNKTQSQLGIRSSREQPSLAHLQYNASEPLANGPGTALAIVATSDRPSSPAPLHLGYNDLTDTGHLDKADGSDGEWSSFARVTQLLASQRQMIAPEALLSLVEAHRDCLSALFRKASSDPLRRQVGSLLAEASIVASRLWSAQGNRTLAIAHCAYARQLADRLTNPTIAAIARIFESNLHSDGATTMSADGDLIRGLRLLEEAATANHLLSPAARARIWAEQAQVYAALRLHRDCHDALVRARNAADDVQEPDRSGLFSDWSPGRLQVYEGTCLLLLGQAKQAADTLTRALRVLEGDPANLNVILAAQVDLASAHLENVQLEEGCRILGLAYPRLANIGNQRGLDRARRARQRMRLWEHERHVRELDALMAASQSPGSAVWRAG